MWFFCTMNPFSILNKLTKLIVGAMGYSETESEEKKEVGCSSEKMEDNLTESKKHENKVLERKECYYNGCGVNDLLEYEAKLTEVKKP